MIYHNTPLSSNLQSLMQMLQSRSTRSQLPMSNAARRQLCLSPEQLRVNTKNEYVPSHDLCVGQDIMFQDSISKRWFPATITSLHKEPRSYNYKRWCDLQKNASSSEAIQATNKQHETRHSISKKIYADI